MRQKAKKDEKKSKTPENKNKDKNRPMTDEQKKKID